MKAGAPAIITAYRLKFGMTADMLARAIGIRTQELEAIENSEAPAPEWLRNRIIRHFGWFDFEAFAAGGEAKTLLTLAGLKHLADTEDRDRKRRLGVMPSGETPLQMDAETQNENWTQIDHTYAMQCAAIRPEAVTALRHLLRMSHGEFSRTLGIPGTVLIEHETGKRIVSSHLVDRIRDKLNIDLFDFEKSDFAQDVISGEGPYSSRMQAK